MTPELRAAADRFIYEQATLKHMMALVPEGGFDRPVDGPATTVRALFGHLAGSLDAYAEAIKAWVADSDARHTTQACRLDEEEVQRFTSMPAVEIVDVFGAGLNALVASLASVPADRIDQPFGDAVFAEALTEWKEHNISHAIPLLRAVPEMRMDALVLNWLLYADFSDDDSNAFQQELLAEAHAYVASLDDEEEDEE